MKNKTLNTFDKEIAESYKNTKVEKIVQVNVITINQLINDYCIKTPNFINIDIEGLQLEVIQSFDFKIYRPEVFCIETQDEDHNKIDEIFNIMKNNNYFVCADTYLNTITIIKK